MPRSGLDAQLGLGAESTYGTAGTITRFLPFTRESLELEVQYVRTAGLRAGRLAQLDELHVATTRQGSGSIEMPFYQKGMGMLLNLLHGDTVTPTQVGTTGAYVQTHNVGVTAPDLKSVTIQVGRTDVGGTRRPFTHLGCKLSQLELECERGGVLNSTWEFDIRDVSTATPLATATYPTGLVPFNFTQGAVLIDDTAPVALVRRAQLRIELPLENDRFSLSASLVKALPVINGPVSITAELECEFGNLDQWNAFVNATRRAVRLKFTGPVISGSENYLLDMYMPRTVTVGQTPTVEGPDVITQTVQLEAVDPGSAAPLTITYKSTDTSL